MKKELLSPFLNKTFTMMRCWSLLAIMILAWNVQGQQQFRLPPELAEVSGLCYAKGDSLWWHNDSGDAPVLYLTDGRGKLQAKRQLPVRHVDWEELAADDRGNLYIGDVGNNRNARRDLCIYVYNPSTEALDSILFDYPDQERFPPPAVARNFDLEGFFWYAGTLHLFSKNKVEKGTYITKLYQLPDQPGRYTASLRDSIYLKKRVVTAASISPNGKTVALLTYDYRKFLGIFPSSATSVFWVEGFEGTNFLSGNWHKQKVRSLMPATQFESLDFIDDQTVLIASERTPVYRQKARRLKRKGKQMKTLTKTK